MPQGQGMEIASRTPTPQQPQKPAPRGDMPSASVGGNRPALNYGQRPGGDATIPQDSLVRGQSSYGDVARAALERNRSRR